MPILILSTSAAPADKLEAFNIGADDYLTKPFETEECLARVYALLRRFHELNPLKTRAYSIVAHGGLVIKRDTRQALRFLYPSVRLVRDLGGISPKTKLPTAQNARP